MEKVTVIFLSFPVLMPVNNSNLSCAGIQIPFLLAQRQVRAFRFIKNQNTLAGKGIIQELFVDFGFFSRKFVYITIRDIRRPEARLTQTI